MKGGREAAAGAAGAPDGTMNRTHDIQGRFLGIPYDWRLPTLRKIADRIFRPRGSMIVPKVWGWGWTLNLAHPGTWVLIAGVCGLAIGAILLG